MKTPDCDGDGIYRNASRTAQKTKLSYAYALLHGSGMLSTNNANIVTFKERSVSTSHPAVPKL